MRGDGSLRSGSGSEEIQSIWGAWYQVDAVGLVAGGGRRDGSAGGEPREAAAAGGGDGLVAWAARSGLPESRGPVRGGLRFVFYGRVSTEDWQDPVTSRARQHEQAAALVRGHGVVVAEFFDAGQSRTVAWGRRPEAAALVAQLADPGRGGTRS